MGISKKCPYCKADGINKKCACGMLKILNGECLIGESVTIINE